MRETSDQIPENIRRFILDYINSVEQLQVLMLLFSDPDRSWTTAQLTQELRSTDTSIEKRLDDLYQRNLLIRNSSEPHLHRLSLYSPNIRTTIQELVAFFEIRPYRIIELIYSRPNLALRDFADAFKIRKDDKS